jgi:hypothetical protein
MYIREKKEERGGDVGYHQVTQLRIHYETKNIKREHKKGLITHRFVSSEI